MKLRILDDAIRLRLDRDEVELIARGTTVACETHFPSGASFGYALTVADTSAATATFDGRRITVTIPTLTAQQWARDDSAVSIKAEAGPTRLLVEKDFECLDPREGEDHSNRFRNPKAAE